jgi:hypothetical protein
MRGVGAYIRTLDREHAQLIESKLSSEAKSALHETSPEVWYPIGIWKETLDRVVECAPDKSNARAAVRAAGRHICEGTVNSFLRVLMRIMTPALFAKKSGSMIGKDFRGFTGGAPDYSYDLSKEGEGVVTMTIKNAGQHPYLGGTGQGFIEFAFHYIGKKNVIIDEPNCALDDYAPDVVHWRIRWS